MGKIALSSNLTNEADKIYGKIETSAGSGKMTADFENRFKDAGSYLEQIKSTLSSFDGSVEQINSLREAFKGLNEVFADSKSASYLETDADQIANITAKWEKFKSLNGKAGKSMQFAEAFKQVDAAVNDLSSDMSKLDVKNVSRQIDYLSTSVNAAGMGGQSFGEVLQGRMRNLVSYVSTFTSFYDIIRYAREALDVITEYDSAFVEMQKVSNDSTTALQDFADRSFDVADSVGTTGVEIQNSAASWMRLGENIDQAEQSAKASTTLLNVSEFEDIDSATEALTSMSQAYTDMDKMDIVDKLNNVGKIIA